MAENRGPVGTVFHEQRPTELVMWLAMQNRFYRLFNTEGQIDPRTYARASQEEAASYRVQQYRRLPSNDILPVFEQLVPQELVPAIHFLSSRRARRRARPPSS